MNLTEPKEAFPYKPPSNEIKDKYQHIFKIKRSLKPRFFKVFFDKLTSFFILIICLPIILFLKIAVSIEGLIIPANKGPLFFYYWAVSGGKRIKKWKIRLIKMDYIDKEKAKNHEWIAYSAEWNEESRTYTGAFVKKWYLDEIPQFWSVFIGDMSIVGPRPLSEMHYERDLAQGNISRFLIRGGLLGLGHIHKGTEQMGNSAYEYEYIDNYINMSSFSLMLFDIKIIIKGIILMLKGGGH